MTARILPFTPANLAAAAAALIRGDVVGMPTETVYGLAGLARDEEALAKIFAAKERPTFDPLIVHVARPADSKPGDNFDWLAFLAKSQLVDRKRLGPLAAERATALTRLWPGPLTLVLPKQASVPDLATSGLPTVAVRAPRHPAAQALLRAVGQPLCAPSANRFGRISPTSAADVFSELGDRIGLILDGGPCEIGLESSVVSVAESGEVTLLRPGAVSRDEVVALAGTKVLRPTADASHSTQAQVSPGLLASHYAPVKPLFLLPVPIVELKPEHTTELLGKLDQGRALGVLAYSSESTPIATQVLSRLLATASPRLAQLTALSTAWDPSEAARNLFRGLRELDAHPGVEVILAEPPPDESGLGYAIADRLRRASAGAKSLRGS